MDGRGGRRDLRWTAAVRAWQFLQCRKLFSVLNYWCELVRTVYISSKAILLILFLGFIFSIKRASNLLFCYSHMGFEIGIMYMTYLLNFRIALQLKSMAQDDPSGPERRETQKWVLSMDLSTPLGGTEMSWREILEAVQIEWKGRIKGKMVRVVNNTLGVSEETGNEEEKKGSEIRE